MTEATPNGSDIAAKWIVGMGCLLPLACAGLLVILLIGGSIWVSIAGPSEESMAEDFGTACYSEVKSQLKDPESASLTDSGVQVIDSGDNPNFKLSGTGRSRNSFGGMATFSWECTGFYSSHSDEAHASAEVYSD